MEHALLYPDDGDEELFMGGASLFSDPIDYESASPMGFKRTLSPSQVFGNKQPSTYPVLSFSTSNDSNSGHIISPSVANFELQQQQEQQQQQYPVKSIIPDIPIQPEPNTTTQEQSPPPTPTKRPAPLPTTTNTIQTPPTTTKPKPTKPKPINHQPSFTGLGHLLSAVETFRTMKPKRYVGINSQGVRWRAQISVNSEIHYLGTFDDKDEAAWAFDRAVRMFKLSRPLNFPLDVTIQRERKLLQQNTRAKNNGEQNNEEELGEEDEEDENERTFIGIYQSGTGWGSTIRVNGQRRYLGQYATRLDAARAYDRAAIPLKRRLNFPDDTQTTLNNIPIPIATNGRRTTTTITTTKKRSNKQSQGNKSVTTGTSSTTTGNNNTLIANRTMTFSNDVDTSKRAKISDPVEREQEHSLATSSSAYVYDDDHDGHMAGLAAGEISDDEESINNNYQDEDDDYEQ